jgi:hypothetical protein
MSHKAGPFFGQLGDEPIGFDPPIRFSGGHRSQDLPFVEPLRRFSGITSFVLDTEPTEPRPVGRGDRAPIAPGAGGFGMGC